MHRRRLARPYRDAGRGSIPTFPVTKRALCAWCVVAVFNWLTARECVYRFIPRQLKELRRSRVNWEMKLQQARLSQKYIFDHGKVHVYAITLVRTPYRAARLLSSASAQGLSVSIFTAIDGLEPFNSTDVHKYAGEKRRIALTATSLLRSDQLRTLYDAYESHQLSENQRVLLHERLRFACYLSHVRLWEKLLKNDWPFLVILEDDVELVRNFSNAAALALSEAPQFWDVIYLNGCLQYFGGQLGRYLVLSRGGLCTFGYMISHKGALHFNKHGLLRSDKPIDHLIDQEVSSGKLFAFHTIPALVSKVNIKTTLAYA